MNISEKLNFYWSIFSSRYIGSRKRRCNFCDNQFSKFLPYRDAKLEPDSFVSHLEIVGSNPKQFSCPYCFSTDRERNLLRFFDAFQVAEQFVAGKRILYIAPEMKFRTYLMSQRPSEILEGDLFPKANEIRVDLEDIQFGSGHFDMVICNHVLEHVRDVNQCLKEIKRVLRVGGVLLAQTPFSAILSDTLEIKEAWGDPKFREAAHGQDDHLRVFGKNFINFIESRGFELYRDINLLQTNEHEINSIGINKDEPFLLFLNSGS